MKPITQQDIDRWRKGSAEWDISDYHVNIVLENPDGETYTIVHIPKNNGGRHLSDHTANQEKDYWPVWSPIDHTFRAEDYLEDIFGVNQRMTAPEFSLDEIAQGEELISQMD